MVSQSFLDRYCPDPTVAYDLIGLYQELNEFFFNGEMPSLAVTINREDPEEPFEESAEIGWDGRMKADTGKFQINNGKITIAKHVAKGGKASICSALLHEMVHKFLFVKGESDSDNHGSNFVLKAGYINRQCVEAGLPYRIHIPKEVVNVAEMYSYLNQTFFEGKLPAVRVRYVRDSHGRVKETPMDVKWDGKLKRTCGTYYRNPNMMPGHGEITLAKGMETVRIFSTLLHEMLHKFLDMECLHDGIKGHGPSFVNHAAEINRKCEELQVPYRIHFFDGEITQEPKIKVNQFLKEDDAVVKITENLDCRQDLDLANKFKKVAISAFGDKSKLFY